MERANRMKLNESSLRQLKLLLVVLGFCVGFFMAWPLAEKMFHSHKAIAFIGDWVVPAFALACAAIGWAIPHRAAPKSVPTVQAWIFPAFVAVTAFCLASAAGAAICA